MTALWPRALASGLGAGKQQLTTTRGAASTTAITNTVASATSVIMSGTAGGTLLSFWFRNGQSVSISGSITARVRALESSLSANCGAGLLIEHWDTAAATLLGTILLDTTIPATITEFTTSDAAYNLAAVSPSNVRTIAVGEWIKITLKLRNVGTMASGFTCTMTYDGPTTGAAGDTWISFTETLVAYGPEALSGQVPTAKGPITGTQKNSATLSGKTPVPTGAVSGTNNYLATWTGSVPVATGSVAGTQSSSGTLSGVVPTSTGALPGTQVNQVTWKVPLNLPLVVGSVAPPYLWDADQSAQPDATVITAANSGGGSNIAFYASFIQNSPTFSTQAPFKGVASARIAPTTAIASRLGYRFPTTWQIAERFYFNFPSFALPTASMTFLQFDDFASDFIALSTAGKFQVVVNSVGVYNSTITPATDTWYWMSLYVVSARAGTVAWEWHLASDDSLVDSYAPTPGTVSTGGASRSGFSFGKVTAAGNFGAILLDHIEARAGGNATGLIGPYVQATRGTLSGSVPLCTGVVNLTQVDPATLSGSVPVLSGSAAGTATDAATLSGSVPVLTGSAAGTAANAGTLSGSGPVLIGSAAGTAVNPGTCSGKVPVLSGSAAGTQANPAIGSGKVPVLTGSLPGTPVVGATLVGSVAPLTGSAGGTAANAGSTTAALPVLTGVLALQQTNSAEFDPNNETPCLTGDQPGQATNPAWMPNPPGPHLDPRMVGDPATLPLLRGVIQQITGAAGHYFFGSNNALRFTPGSVVATGAWSVVGLINPVSGNNYLVQGINATTNQVSIARDTGALFGPGDFTAGYPSNINNAWQIWAITKPAGSAHYRYHTWTYAADGSGTMSHGETVSAANHSNPTGITEIRLGAGPSNVGMNGDFAVGAIWDRALSDAELDSLKSPHLSAWAALTPQFLADLQNWDGTAGYRVDAGTSTYVGIIGSISVGVGPPLFDYTLVSTNTGTLSGKVPVLTGSIADAGAPNGGTLSGKVPVLTGSATGTQTDTAALTGQVPLLTFALGTALSGSAYHNWYSFPNWVDYTAGNFLGSGAFTLAVLLRPDAPGLAVLSAGADTSTPGVTLYADSGGFFSGLDFTSGWPFTQGVWQIWAVTKVAGAALHRYHVWTYAAAGTGSFSHGSPSGEATHADIGTAATVMRTAVIGTTTAGFNGAMAVWGAWDRALSDAELDTLMSSHLSAWSALTPQALVQYDGWTGSTGEVVAVGTNTRISITNNGSTAIDSDVGPPSFDYTLAGGNNNGTLSGKVPILTGSQSGTESNAATLSGKVPTLTGSQSGTATDPATASGAVPVLTGTLTGTLRNTATLTGQVPTLSGSASGTLSDPATLTGVKVPVLTGAVAGTQTCPATLSGNTPVLTGALADTPLLLGTLTGNVPVLTGSVSATQVAPAALSGSVPVLRGSMQDVPGLLGVLTGSVPPLTGTLSGTLRNPATLSGQVSVLTSGFTATQADAATLTGAVPVLTGQASGSVVGFAVLSGSTPLLTGTVSGTQIVTGTLSGSVPVLTGSLPGVIITPIAAVLSGSVPRLTGTVPGAQLVTGTTSGAVPLLTGALSGGAGLTATLSGTVPLLTGTLPGSVAAGIPTTLVGAVPLLAGAFTGSFVAPVVLLIPVTYSPVIQVVSTTAVNTGTVARHVLTLPALRTWDGTAWQPPPTAPVPPAGSTTGGITTVVGVRRHVGTNPINRYRDGAWVRFWTPQ